MKNKIILALVLFGFFWSCQVNAATKFSMTTFIESLIAAGVINFNDIVKAKVWAIEYDKTTNLVTASTTAHIQVLTPANGVTWEIDRDIPYEVTWGSQGASDVYISLVGGKKGDCLLNNEPIKTGDGNHSYKILPKRSICHNLATGTTSPLIDGSYKLLVEGKDKMGIDVSDSSDSNITISPIPIPSIKVTSPNGKESLSRVINYNVKYTTDNIDESMDEMVRLSLINKNGEVVYKMQKRMKDGTLKLDWPGTLSAGAYKVKLSITDKDTKITVEDESDDYFWLSTGY